MIAFSMHGLENGAATMPYQRSSSDDESGQIASAGVTGGSHETMHTTCSLGCLA